VSKYMKLITTTAVIFLSALYSVLFLTVVVEHIRRDGAWNWDFAAYVIAAVIFVPLVLRWMATKETRVSRHAVRMLFVTCIAVKLAWVLAYPTVPRVDYLTFYKAAQMLADSWTIDFHYVALFPHILGYSSFLSVFFAIFGDGLLVAPILNVILSAVGMLFIYDIGKRLLDERAAVIASLVWILYPSQTIYNTMVLSEPLYTTLILGFWAWMIRLHDKLAARRYGPLVASALGASLLLAVIHSIRPLSWVLFLALAIWMVLALRWYMGEGARKLTFLLVTAGGLWILGLAVDWFFVSRLGEKAATTVGFNVYVGFNEASRGRWNQEDSDHLFRYVRENPHWTADDVQRKMMEDAIDRIMNGNIRFMSLFYDKLHYLWGEDAMAFRYSDLPKQEAAYMTVSNAYYIVSILFSIIGLVLLIRQNRRSAALMLCLFMLGLTAAHLIAEVAYRYHYSGTAVLSILAGVGVIKLYGLRLPKRLHHAKNGE